MGLKELRNWQQERANEYCPKCTSTCCNAQKFDISMDVGDAELFLQNGIPLIYCRDLAHLSFNMWLGGRQQIFDKSDKPLDGPAIIRREHPFERDFLYAFNPPYCPFYDNKRNLCKVHETPRRPQVCKDYPIFVRNETLTFMENCPPFYAYENRKIAFQLFKK